MVSQCRICKYCAIDDISEYCEKDSACMEDAYMPCPYFEQIENISEYLETDTVCDNCPNSDKCSLISVTNIFDKKIHYSDIAGNECEIDKAARNYWEWNDDIEGEDEE